MSVSVVETKDPVETEALGAELAAGLRDGDVVLVRGELGSGKTTFVRGAARALGVTDPITSPTFSIGHRYRATEHDRLAPGPLPPGGRSASGGSGAAGRLSRSRADRLRGVAGQDSAELAGARVRVTLAHLGEDRRRVEVVEG